jgi:hypothetical protein
MGALAAVAACAAPKGGPDAATPEEPSPDASTNEDAAVDASIDASVPLDAGYCAAQTRFICCELGCETDTFVMADCFSAGWKCPDKFVPISTCPPGSCQQRPPPTQQSYAYPGCDGGTYYCPNDLTVRCALDQIDRKHSACTTTADCALAPIDGGCTGYGDCPPAAVSSAAVAPFRTDAVREVSAYCATPSCTEAGLCAYPLSAFEAVCAAGECVTVLRDAG